MTKSTKPPTGSASGLTGSELGELVYTSAPSNLSSSTGHLGVVAKTRDFSPEIERELKKFWAYTMPSELQQIHAQPIPRYALMPIENWTREISLTRVQDAGVDHTGRTNLIAQHFVANIDSLSEHRSGIADLITWALRGSPTDKTKRFLDRWEGEPRILEKQILPKDTPSASPFSFLSEGFAGSGLGAEQLEEALLSAVDTLTEYSVKQRMVVVVLKPKDALNVLYFLGAILSSLPKSKQIGVTAISHVWDLNDAPSGYSLAFTYPRSPFLERVKERTDLKKPLILDLAMKSPDIPASKSIYAGWLKKDRIRWNSLANPPIPQLFDAVDPKCKLESMTFSFKNAIHEWESEKSVEQFVSVCIIGQDGISGGMNEEDVQQIIQFVAADTVDVITKSKQWADLFEILWDERVPVYVCLDALAEIVKHIATIMANKPDLVAMGPSTERLFSVCIVGQKGILSGMNEMAIQQIIEIVGAETVNGIIQSTRWADLSAILWEKDFPDYIRPYVFAAIEKHIVDIAANNPDLVARATTEKEGFRLTKQLVKLANHGGVVLDCLLSKTEEYASNLPLPNARIAATNWSLLGTWALKSAWTRLSSSLAKGLPPSQFYRRIVDRLIPIIVENHQKQNLTK